MLFAVEFIDEAHALARPVPLNRETTDVGSIPTPLDVADLRHAREKIAFAAPDFDNVLAAQIVPVHEALDEIHPGRPLNVGENVCVSSYDESYTVRLRSKAVLVMKPQCSHTAIRRSPRG